MIIRTLQVVVTELLRTVIMRKQHKIMLQDFSNKIQIAERGIRNLICPVLLMMIYVRTEYEGEFGLHLVCMLVKK